jgi:hypothetical protein
MGRAILWISVIKFTRQGRARLRVRVRQQAALRQEEQVQRVALQLALSQPELLLLQQSA